jgi:hypothetical protein
MDNVEKRNISASLYITNITNHMSEENEENCWNGSKGDVSPWLPDNYLDYDDDADNDYIFDELNR